MDLNVCVVPAGYKPIPPALGGAVETIVQNMIDINEIEKKINFTVLSVENDDAKAVAQNYLKTNYVFFKGLEKLDTLYYWCIYKVLKKFFNIIVSDYILKRKMVKYISKHQMDFNWIIIEAGEIDSIKYYSKYIDKKKIIYHSHGEVVNRKKLENDFSYYISVSDFVKKTWNDSVQENRKNMSITLRNGINQNKFNVVLDLDYRREKRTELGFNEEDCVLVFVGRIIPEKGVLELLKAIELLPNNIKLLMIGSSSFGKKTNTVYEKKVKDYIGKLRNRVVFSGYVPNEKIGDMYKMGDIAVVPSMFNDPAPLVIIESMAAGLPIVTTGSGGITEYCNDECSIVVERGLNFEERLAEVIMALANDKNLRSKMGKASKKAAKNLTDVNQYFSLVDILLKLQ